MRASSLLTGFKTCVGDDQRWCGSVARCGGYANGHESVFTPDKRKSPPPRTTRPKSPPGSPLGQQRVSPFSSMVFLLLMAWNLWSFLPKPTSEAALPYSAFVAQVAAGNVTQTRIVGDQIERDVRPRDPVARARNE